MALTSSTSPVSSGVAPHRLQVERTIPPPVEKYKSATTYRCNSLVVESCTPICNESKRINQSAALYSGVPTVKRLSTLCVTALPRSCNIWYRRPSRRVEGADDGKTDGTFESEGDSIVAKDGAKKAGCCCSSDGDLEGSRTNVVVGVMLEISSDKGVVVMGCGCLCLLED